MVYLLVVSTQGEIELMAHSVRSFLEIIKICPRAFNIGISIDISLAHYVGDYIVSPSRYFLLSVWIDLTLSL